MSDIVQTVVKEKGMSVRDIFLTAYKEDKDADYHNYSWATQIYQRSGIITRTVEAFCKRRLEGEQLPLDYPQMLEEWGK